jgi:hypothetical protein
MEGGFDTRRKKHVVNLAFPDERLSDGNNGATNLQVGSPSLKIYKLTRTSSIFGRL